MFTGIIEEVGTVLDIQGMGKGSRLRIAASAVLKDVRLGDSIAVNGVCLTVTSYSSEMFTADVVPETMRRTNLHTLRAGSPVNLERAMSMDRRFGGHIVTGHIDGVGELVSIHQEDNAHVLTVRASASILRYILPKGSVALNGISLTVMDVQDDTFRVSLIPHTRGVTTAGTLRPGSQINIECDIIGKYVERLLSFATSHSAGTSLTANRDITFEFLREHGFA
jgi:riboflavin synthase